MDQVAAGEHAGEHGLHPSWYWLLNLGNKCDKEEERCIKLQEVVEFAH